MDGRRMDGWMEVVFFSLNISGDLGLSAFPLCLSVSPIPSRRTDRQKEGLACPARGPRTRGHARRMNQMSELFMSCSISGHFVCIQPLPARPRLFDYAQQSSRNWKRYVPLILGRRVRETNHVCHWKNDTRVCVEWENIQQSVCSTSTIVYVRGIFIFRRCSYFPYLLMWYSQICNKTR